MSLLAQIRNVIQRTLFSEPTRPDTDSKDAELLVATAAAVQSIFNVELPLETRIDQALAYIGEATRASHVYIFENDFSGDSVRVNLRQRWCAKDTKLTGSLPDLQNFVLRAYGFERWEEKMKAGEAISGHVRQFPQAERLMLRSTGIRSLLVMPVTIDGTWWGFLGIDDVQQERNWTPGEEHTLRIVANVLCAIIQRSQSDQEINRLYNAEREQRQLAQALRDAGICMTATLDYEAVLDLLLDQIKQVVPYETASVMLVGDQNVSIIRGRGYERYGETASEDLLRFSFAIDRADNLRYIIERQSPLVIPDVEQDARWIRTEMGAHVRSWAGVPIVAQERVLAIISLDKTEPNYYKDAHTELLTAFANQAALALQNARLFAETTEMLKREQGLNELIRSISTTLDLPTALRKLLKLSTELVGADMGGLALLTPDGNAIRSAYTYNMPASLDENRDRGDPGWVSLIVENQAPVLMADYARHPLAAQTRLDGSVTSLMSVPVVTGDDYLGVLVILSQRPEKRFSERDIALMESIGRHAGAAIQNVWLFQAVRRRAEEAETLRQASSAVTSALDLSMVLDRILIQVAR
ncbi:MAG: GAF domain-containing protein [Anaerolineaceae bacterium]